MGAANGRYGSTERMAEIVVNEVVFTMTIKRFPEFVVEFSRKNGMLLGINVDYIDTGGCLSVTSISEGQLLHWNTSYPEREIRVGDRVVSVNGCRGDAVKMLMLCGQEESLALRVIRL